MPEYAPGTPSWVELSSPDPDASARFYGELMGWEAVMPGPVEQTGGYRIFLQDGKSVSGLMGHTQQGQPTVWSTYVNVTDADDTAAKAKANGGSVAVEPMDVMDLGRMAYIADPAGAVIGVWEPKSFSGADLVNEPNSLCWTELMTRDHEAGRAFYPAVFGWTAGKPQFPDAPESYTIWELGGQPIGGMMQMTDEYFPKEAPSQWSVCFAVADCDATAARARELGASIAYEPTDMSIGRFANIVDPQGAPFSVMKLNAPV
jgi:uncharacterized protein